MAHPNDEHLVELALKNYRLLRENGGTDKQFQMLLQDKCFDPRILHLHVQGVYNREMDKKDEVPEDRNEPFRVEKNMRAHLFAKKMFKKILGTNRLF